MKTALKITGLLFGFFLVLCININERPLFSYLYNVISPATKYTQNATQSFFKKSFSSTQSYSKKLFDNSVPRVKDSVASKLSANKKGGEPEERITEEEKEELDSLIKNH